MVERGGALRILAEAFSPGARVADFCRRHDISSGLIYTWRRKLREAGRQTLPDAVPEPVSAQAVMDEVTLTGSTGQHPAIIVDLERGKRMRPRRSRPTLSPGKAQLKR